MSPAERKARRLAVTAGFLSWFFAGVQMAVMPVAARSASRELMGAGFNDAMAGQWFAWYTVAFLLGGAGGGLVFGALGDRFGRARAMAASVITFSLFAGAGAFVESQPQLLAVRFLASLGIGGVWPNCMSLAAESWPDASRPFLAGLLGCASNVGVAAMGALGRWYPVTAQSWRTVMLWSILPVVVGVFIWWRVAESAAWRRAHGACPPRTAGARAEILRHPWLGRTLVGIALGTVPLLGAWGAGKWLFPWTDTFGDRLGEGFKGTAQFLWGVGAAVGSFFGGRLAAWLGRRVSYFAISAGSLAVNWGIFRFLTPDAPAFLPAVFVLGFVSTLFFGWLPLYLPELFPTRMRATGTGVSYNFGRILSAVGVLGAGMMMNAFAGDYARVGMTVSFIYAVGMIIIWWAPDTRGAKIEE